MGNDASTAFAPLEERAARTTGVVEPDRISVRDHIVDVEIGAFQAERDTTQRLRFSVVVEVAPSTGAVTDDVDDILSYDTVTEAIEAELAAERLNLLETLAERIADRILTEPQSLRVFVRIEKLDRGPGNLGVEIVRDRSSERLADGAATTVHPTLIYLDNSAFSDPALGGFLDRLQADERAFVLCVSQRDQHSISAADGGPQRHIDLLSIEQNAWHLSSIDPRCVVVGTRTELDWGMKNDQVSVWAPSKIVLDTVGSPISTDPLGLAVWIGEFLNAGELLVIGADVPDISSLTCRAVTLAAAP
ncbi:dihydroneopterin aldolase [Aliiroseovarius sp. 2305UL8-7]|uniref:dihydroneopterin aldolase n=1 Tax=Aliiroseovarius conchicola TaxID=3121637 RepID=UPI0035279D71